MTTRLKKDRGFEEGACELLAEEICKQNGIQRHFPIWIGVVPTMSNAMTTRDIQFDIFWFGTIIENEFLAK